MTAFHVISLFPESFRSYLGASIVKRAEKKGSIKIAYYNPRDFVSQHGKKNGRSPYKDRRVDDRPYGGGPGMVIQAMPVARAIEAAVGQKLKVALTGKNSGRKKVKIIFFVPHGDQFTNDTAESLRKYSDIVLVCGRYEGIDARIRNMFPVSILSIGPYILTGGELPAMVVLDAVTRRISGVLGDDLSVEERRIAGTNVYTRPEVLQYKGKKYRVPKILLTGHHKKINEWKLKKRGKKS
ncbi:MAG: tRNA (guanine37-N1)-methyltransferase [Candidatus Parcubacteria bacterium]|jgi:tRNA (guanine37-N1)-methyltransferase|nr:tRNA (guanine37-N1)-methyltransferase [Candidatus Parcubacteria bacterium]